MRRGDTIEVRRTGEVRHVGVPIGKLDIEGSPPVNLYGEWFVVEQADDSIGDCLEQLTYIAEQIAGIHEALDTKTVSELLRYSDNIMDELADMSLVALELRDELAKAFNVTPKA